MKARQRTKIQPLPREVYGKINEHERAAAREAKNGRLENQPYPRVR